MAKRNDTKRWLDRHRNDPWVRAAQKENYRSRAAYKLAQIQQKDQLIRSGMTIVDLGCAPGGWSQFCARNLAGRGRIVGLDLLDMEPIAGVEFIREDFNEQAGLDALRGALDGDSATLVLSDMAPNLSGVAVADQMRMMQLAGLALDFCQDALQPGGDFLVKVFQGEGFDTLLRDMRQHFKKVAVRKPEASRDASRENYLLGRGWRG